MTAAAGGPNERIPPAGGETFREVEEIRDHLSRIESRIAEACHRAGRPRSEVTLMAVSKTHPASAILAAASLGVTLFGENRVAEFQRKRVHLPWLRSPGAPAGGASPQSQLDVRFHLIGHLQSNKAGRAAELFSSVDSLDSLRLAERLNEAAGRLHRRLPVMLEIKLSQEKSKTGLDPGAVELDELLERLPDLGALEPNGLMTIPPYHDDPEAARPYFARLRELRDRFAVAHPRLGWAALSMGMSHDFAVAIEEGATQIRIGTALFGSRKPGPTGLG